MMTLIREALAPVLDGILRFIPDPGERARAKEQFEMQMLGAMAGLVQGQLAINQEQARHTSIFVAGARPFLLWVCGVGFAWQFIGQPLVQWAFALWAPDITHPPPLDIGPLMTLALGMLGLGGLRTYEKRLGVARGSL